MSKRHAIRNALAKARATGDQHDWNTVLALMGRSAIGYEWHKREEKARIERQKRRRKKR